jgi:hypothetical protein
MQGLISLQNCHADVTDHTLVTAVHVKFEDIQVTGM